MNQDDAEKRRLADALDRMTGQPPLEEPQAPSSSNTTPPDPPSQKPGPRVRPAFPTLTTSDAESQAVNADRVIMPAVTPDYLLAKHRAAAARTAPPPMHQSLRVRRTIVPILLTLGLLLPLLGALWFLTDDDSPFRALNIAVPISLIAVGVILFILAILNIVHLAHVLRSNAPTPSR